MLPQAWRRGRATLTGLPHLIGWWLHALHWSAGLPPRSKSDHISSPFMCTCDTEEWVKRWTRLRNHESLLHPPCTCDCVYRSLRSSRQRWRWTSPAVTRTCSPVSWMRTSAHGSAWFRRRIPRTSFGISPSAQRKRWKYWSPACEAFQDFKWMTCLFIKHSFFKSNKGKHSFVFYSCLLGE